jgi:PAS domain-containing protein
VKHLHVLARAPKTPSGELEYIGAATDVTAAKQAEEKLRRSEESLLDAQRLSHTSSFKHDIPTGRVIVSPEVYRIYGIDPDKDPRTRNSSLVAFILRIVSGLRNFLKEPKSRKSTFKWTTALFFSTERSNTSTRFGHPVLNESGELVEYVGTTMDVTEHWQARAVLG